MSGARVFSHASRLQKAAEKRHLVERYFDSPSVYHNRRILPQDAQKGRSARPQRVKARGVPLRYVEGLNDARTQLAEFFSILQESDMIAIIDYGMGNLRSVSKAFEAVGHQAVVTRDSRVIGNASHVVLPGVGAFGDCMANIERYGLAEPIRAAIQSGKPFLGICLGLQLLFEESEEFGTHKGLGIIPGKVRRFAPVRG